MRRQLGNKGRKRVLGAITILTTILVMSLFLGYALYQMRAHYEIRINNLMVEKEESMLHVYITTQDLNKGVVINEQNTKSLTTLASMKREEYITSEDFGKVLLIDVPKDTQLIKAMFYEPLQVGVREVQCDSVLLSDNLQEYDYVDVRLALPNGEDYVVLSKKSVHGLIQDEWKSTCYLWLNEEEIVKYSAAVVDANQYKGASLYTTKYIKPTIQEATKVTYVPSYQTLELSFKQQQYVEAKQELTEVWD